MTYGDLLGYLGQFNLLAWLLVAIISPIAWIHTRTAGWAMISAGAVFVVLRQAWKLLPSYKLTQESEFLFNAYMLRYVLGSIGALLLCIGLTMLIVNYHVLKARLQED